MCTAADDSEPACVPHRGKHVVLHALTDAGGATPGLEISLHLLQGALHLLLVPQPLGFKLLRKLQREPRSIARPSRAADAASAVTEQSPGS